MIVLVGGAVSLDDGIIQRRCRIAFAGDLGGDALVNLRGQSGIDQDRHLGLAQHVDETRGNHLALSVDGPRSRRGAQIADGGNFPVANSDVTRIPRRSGAIDDVAVGDDQVELWRRSRQRKGVQTRTITTDTAATIAIEILVFMDPPDRNSFYELSS